jgi:hypothetical protein
MPRIIRSAMQGTAVFCRRSFARKDTAAIARWLRVPVRASNGHQEFPYQGAEDRHLPRSSHLPDD